MIPDQVVPFHYATAGQEFFTSAPGITYEKPIPSCDAAGPGAISGMYWLQPNGWKSPFEIFCDFSLVERGCALIWKHSYFEVKPSALMTTFSKFNKPCFDLSTGWCNVGHKEAIPGSEQMTVAYHNGRVGYAYKGDRNPLLGKEWKGGILNNAFKIVDHCTASNGVRPEPTILSTGIPGLTWDKHNPGVHTGNCDTDEYRKGKGSDCRWQNCKLPKSLSPTAYNDSCCVFVLECPISLWE
eukprot:m.232156 g.232156  ORF g.232156 m.232156 type:complete len:240 (+) comp40075_c2_seq85:2691-3410(+)